MRKRITVRISFLLYLVMLFPSLQATDNKLDEGVEMIYHITLPTVEVVDRYYPFYKLTNSVLEDVMSKETPDRNPHTIGDTHLKDYALGILQIRMCCLNDVNKIYGKSYTSNDRINVDKSIEIYHLYLEKGISLYLKKYDRLPTKIEVQAMWNGGIYGGYRNAQALRYARK